MSRLTPAGNQRPQFVHVEWLLQHVVDTGRSDCAVGSVRLAGGVGDYGVRVYTRNRAEAVRRYADLYKMNADPLGDEFQQARKRLEGLEQYLVQLWRES